MFLEPDDIKELTGKDFLQTAGIQKGELDILDGLNLYKTECRTCCGIFLVLF